MQYSGNPKWPLHAFDYDTYTNFSMDSRNDLINFENIDICIYCILDSAFDDVKVKVLVGQLVRLLATP